MICTSPSQGRTATVGKRICYHWPDLSCRRCQASASSVAPQLCSKRQLSTYDSPSPLCAWSQRHRGTQCKHPKHREQVMATNASPVVCLRMSHVISPLHLLSCYTPLKTIMIEITQSSLLPSFRPTCWYGTLLLFPDVICILIASLITHPSHSR